MLTEVLVGLAILVGLIGVVLPVLPGSLTIFVAILVWALLTSSVAGWSVLVVATALLLAGWSATYVFTGRRVSAAGVPRRAIVLAGLAGIVGFFVVPVLGLFLFFVGALYAQEHLRLRDAAAARSSAWTAVRATAIGLLIELGLALMAASVWLVAVLTGVGPA